MYVIVNTQNSMEHLEDEPRTFLNTAITFLKKIRKMGLRKFKTFQDLTDFQKSHDKVNVKRKLLKISLIKICLHR